MRQVAWTLLVLAGGATFMDLREVALFLALAAVLTALGSYEPESRRDARRRNQAHRVR